MREDKGNLWTYPGVAVRVVTTNGVVKNNGALVMGRGCAQQLRDSMPGVDLMLGQHVRKNGNVPCRIALPGRPFDIWTMPVKHKWDEPADIDLIRLSATKMMRLARTYGVGNVVIPRPGCGNGQLQWSTVRHELSPILDDRFIAITFK